MSGEGPKYRDEDSDLHKEVGMTPTPSLDELAHHAKVTKLLAEDCAAEVRILERMLGVARGRLEEAQTLARERQQAANIAYHQATTFPERGRQEGP